MTVALLYAAARGDLVAGITQRSGPPLGGLAAGLDLVQ